MFADSVCESSWADRARRARASVVSFALQALAVSGLLLLPLFYSQTIPQLQFMSALVAPAPPPPAPQAFHAASGHGIGSPQITVPNYETRGISQAPDAGAPPALDFHQLNSLGSAAFPGILNSPGIAVNVAPPPVVAMKPPRVSRMMEGNLVSRVQPVYPPLARQARIQGAVVLRALISREGLIENLQILSGHPMLAQAAIEAVKQWRYRPYMLNGEPIEVETQVTVNFSLGGN